MAKPTPSRRMKQLAAQREAAGQARGRRRSRKQDSFVTRLARGGTTIIRALEFARRNPFDPTRSSGPRQKVQALVMALAIALVLSTALSLSGWLDGVEAQLFDWRVKTLTSNGTKDSRIAVIDIDEATLTDVVAQGWTYPWPRAAYNPLIKYCRRAGAKAIVFDMYFSDSARNTNGVDAILGEHPEFAWDDLFAAQAVNADNVVVACLLSNAPAKDARPHAARFFDNYILRLEGGGAERARAALVGEGYQDLTMPLRQLVTGRLDVAPALMVKTETGKEAVDYDALKPDQLPAMKTRVERVLGLVEESIGGDKSYAGMLPDGYQPRGIAGIGSADAFPDETDGVFRSYNLAVRLGEHVIPSLALEALRISEGRERPAPVEVLANGDWKVGTHVIPADDRGRIRLKFHGRLPSEEIHNAGTLTPEELAKGYPDGTAPWVYPRVPASSVMADVIELERRDKNARAIAAGGEVPPADRADKPLRLGDPAARFKDKIVFIAGSAGGLHDIRANPLSRTAAGVELHLAALDNILNNDYLLPPPRVLPVLLAALLGAIVCASVIFARGYWISIGTAVILMAGNVGVAFAAYQWFNYDWPIAAPGGAAIAVGFVSSAILKFFTLDAHTRQLRHFSEQYMGADLVEFVISHPDSLKLGGEKRNMSIYFSDIAGFTTMSEKLDPAKLTEVLNVYLSAMTHIVLEHGGMVDKYIGDAVMALWGAPKMADDHAIRSCRAALAMKTRLFGLQPRFKEIAPELVKFDAQGKPLPEIIEARAGINTGIVTAGNMGSHVRFSYTVMGDVVNQASRFEGANKTYGSWIMIGDETERMTAGGFVTRPLDLLVVKGKTAPARVHELLGEGDLPDDQRQMLAHYRKGFSLYHDRQFAAALDEFRKSAALEISRAHNPSLLYVERCEGYIETPPPAEWDGVFVLKTK